MGVLHQPDACEPARSTLSPCPAPTGLTKSPSATGIPAVGADPFTVYAYVDCGPVGADLREYERRAREHLTRGEERAAELVFMTGTVSTTGAPLISPHLAEDTAVVGPGGEISQLAASPVTTGAYDVVEAVGALEGALASCYGGVGVIHVPRVALAHLDHASIVHRVGDHLETLGGNLVAAGSGYPGTTPAGAAPPGGQAYFYATGAVSLRRGPIRIGAAEDAIDQTNNQLVLIAERTYVITWDCCLFSAHVSLGGFDAGAVGGPN
jgi:hypothetical protein